MILLITAAALLVIASFITYRCWPAASEGAPGPLERATSVAVIVCGLWICSTWALALTRHLTVTGIAFRTTLLLIVAVPLLVAGRAWFRVSRKRPAMLLLALLPALAWSSFALWRGAIVPPLSHDALSYHLPKAVLWERYGGFRYLTELEPRQRNIPANYELLLAEVLVTAGDDTYTEWPSTATYLLFVIACGALAERWWMRRGAVASMMIFAAGIPVALLHAGAHKNDLMMGFFAVAAMVFAGRFLQRGDLAALLLLITAVALGLGTKPQIAALALFLAPFVLYRLWRRITVRKFGAIVAFGLLAFLMLGGAVYVENFAQQRSLAGRYSGGSVITYGDWANLWEAPYVLLAAPFASKSNALPVPWETRPWFWQRYEIYFSHLGIPFAICVVLSPLMAFVLRRNGGLASFERTAVTAASIAAFVMMLPVVFVPHGLYSISLPRYALFIVPVVFGWTVAPVAARSRAAAASLALVGVVSFAAYGVDNARRDAFAPLEYVLWARAHPGTREIYFDNGRAASVVDRLAGPRDKIAFDAGYASWIHPAFGAELTRPVYFIPPGTGPATIPDDAKWVVVDRAWGIFWGGGAKRDLSAAREYLMRGQPEPEELRVRRQLLRDRRFRIAYLQRGTNQIVFERVR